MVRGMPPQLGQGTLGPGGIGVSHTEQIQPDSMSLIRPDLQQLVPQAQTFRPSEGTSADPNYSFLPGPQRVLDPLYGRYGLDGRSTDRTSKVIAMRDDLLDARAAIDWAIDQLPLLDRRVASWFNQGAYRWVEEPHPEMSQTLIKLRDVKPLPPIINAEVGAIINSIRSSLDLLATALAHRHCIPKPDDMYFPVAKSAAEFASGRGYKGTALIKGLPPTEREIIESVKPYSGGNDALVALHKLDITRKHRRLIGVRLVPSSIVVTPEAQRSGLGFPNIWPGFQEDAVIAWTRIDAAHSGFQMALQITFNEAELLPSRPVTSALSDLAALATSIVQLFDTP